AAATTAVATAVAATVAATTATTAVPDKRDGATIDESAFKTGWACCLS
ncbi:MAG: hypothetical protein H7X78_08425, partial [Methyloceanibacter sp.]|nr:hypothetical protein [Methyloceanibacter sp.]